MKQTLVLVRVGPTTFEPDDEALRPLSRKGRQRVGVAMNALWRLDLRMDRLVHAPTRAAAETAEVLSPLAAELLRDERLLGSPDKALLERLQGETVGVVGHQPWLGELAAWLVVGKRTRGDLLRIERAGVVVLRGRMEPGGLQLRELWSSRALRMLG